MKIFFPLYLPHEIFHTQQPQSSHSFTFSLLLFQKNKSWTPKTANIRTRSWTSLSHLGRIRNKIFQQRIHFHECFNEFRKRKMRKFLWRFLSKKILVIPMCLFDMKHDSLNFLQFFGKSVQNKSTNSYIYIYIYRTRGREERNIKTNADRQNRDWYFLHKKKNRIHRSCTDRYR